jgi:5-methyltetrahydrofolate--homocysteine methyltransferase
MNQELYDGICKGNRKLVSEIVQSEIDNNCDPVELLLKSMIPAMRDVGDKFSRNEVFVPEMLIAARAMQAGLDLIEPKLIEVGHEPLAKVVVGTVKGDLHDIGKNLVVMMLKGAGFEVDDAGVDCDVSKFDKSVEDGAQAVCCSALLTTTMPYMKNVVDHFTDKDAKVVIGGAPVTQAYCDEIGADGFADNASDAVNAVASSLGIAV